MTKAFNPRPYQWQIVNHILKHDRSAIWAGMGMGKTVSTLFAINLLQELDGMGPALILAPLRVAQSTWPDEVTKWERFKGMRVVALTGARKQRAEALKQKADIYCINYEQVPWLVEELDGKWPFDMIVADESTRLKSFRFRQGGQRARALASVAYRSQRFVELTGTPASNGLLDLWGQMWFLDKGERLGSSMNKYKETMFRPVRVGVSAFAVRWEPLDWTEKAVLEKTKDLTLKLNAEDWFPIEKPIVTNLTIDLPPKVRDLYNSMESKLWVEINNEVVETANAATKTNACLQIAGGHLYVAQVEDYKEINKACADIDDEPEYSLGVHHGVNPYYDLHTEKLTVLRSIVEEANGMPVLVSYQFRHEAAAILNAFKDARLLDKDPKTIRDWNAGKIPMLLAHPASCGHGLSLQDGGNILVFYSTGWNLEEHEQIIERIGPTRQAQAGHKRPVFVYNIIAKHTLDEVVQQRITTKREVLDLLLERKNHE